MDVIDPEKFAEQNPQSRFRLLNVPILAPGTCILCKSPGGDGRQFIDLGIQVDWFGAMYFCTYCISEAASLLGLISQADIDQIVAAHNEMAEKYNELLASSMEMENATRLLLRNCHCEPAIPGESFATVDVEADSEPIETNSDLDESSGVEGSDSVSEPASDDVSTEPASPKRRRTNSKSDE